MIDKTDEIVTINSGIELDQVRFGQRASSLSKLTSLGLPIPDSMALSANLVSAIHAKKTLPKLLESKLRNCIYCMRSSPISRSWGGVEAILYLGMNHKTVEKLTYKVGRHRAIQLYFNFIKTFSAAVFDLDPEIFETLIDQELKLFNVISEQDLPSNAYEELSIRFLDKFRKELGFSFPSEIVEQVNYALISMAKAWYTPSSKLLRSSLHAPDNAGMGIILQEMIISSRTPDSGIGSIQGVDTILGTKGLYGYFNSFKYSDKSFENLFKTSHSIVDTNSSRGKDELPKLEDYPNAINELKSYDKICFLNFGKNLRFDFLLDEGKLWIVDCCVAKLSSLALINITVQAVQGGLLSKEDALLAIDPYSLADNLHAQIDRRSEVDVFGSGLPASPGAATGKIVFSAEDAVQAKAQGADVILVRQETSPDDIRGMYSTVGVFTMRGGMTSHAAVVARGLGLPCIVSVKGVKINVRSKTLKVSDGRQFNEGDLITIDGTSGQVLSGAAQLIQPDMSRSFIILMDWADEIRQLKVKANADTPEDATVAKKFNADGIGLCRTEHMFFEKARIMVMQRMILAKDYRERSQEIEKLLPMQKKDFSEIFGIMKGSPVTIRLLDLPLHEFLTNSKMGLKELAREMNISASEVIDRSKNLHEINPMLGKRGVRSGLLLPELYKMQVQAIFEAVADAFKKEPSEVIVPEIMIPLVSATKEVEYLKESIEAVAKNVRDYTQVNVSYKLGVMIETPRAALIAGELAELSSFLNFGTNDLTQMTYGVSRDDSGGFMREYVAKNIYEEDPFHSLDEVGVGELLKIAIKRGRASNKKIKLGICGEHGGDPASIKFCGNLGFDYVSCSPYRVPIARLAAAQATLLANRKIKFDNNLSSSDSNASILI